MVVTITPDVPDVAAQTVYGTGPGDAIEMQLETIRWLKTDEGCLYLMSTVDRGVIISDHHKSKEELDRFVAGVAGAPLHAPAYYWPAEMGQMILAAAHSLPETTITREQFMSKDGLLFFERPLHLGEHVYIHALGWAQTSWGVQIIGYENMGMPFMPPTFSTPWKWGEDTPVFKEWLAGGYEASEWATRVALVSAKVVQAACLFMQQSLIERVAARPGKGTRARAERAKHEATLEIIQLRRKHYEGHGGDARHVEWTCQWMVTGHWRQQWYASDQTHRPKWILPYVKGPEDKPLRHSERVYAVVR